MKRGLIDMPHLLERLRSPLLVGGKGGGLVGARGKLDVVLTGLSDRLRVAAPLAAKPSLPDDSDDDEDEDGDDEKVTGDGIAVVQVIGSLVHRNGMDALSGMTSYAEISEEIAEALADSNVKAILLEIDSGGGEVSGCFELADKIVAARDVKPIHAFVNCLACSGAYALASACQSVTITATGDVGSVGVVLMHTDQSASDQKEGLKFTYVYAGDRKVDGNPHAPLSPRAHATIQGEIDKIYEMFVKRVAASRGMSQTSVRNTEAGTFMGEAAVAAGFADQVGTLEDALAAVRADISRRKAKMSLSKAATMLALSADATEDHVISALDAKLKAHADALARVEAAEKKAAETEVAAKLLAEQVSKLEGERSNRDASHAIELTKARALEAGLPPIDKQVEDDARELFAAGKIELAKRTLERHVEASRSKVAALGGPTVRLQRDEPHKTPTSKESVLEKAKENAAKLMASGSTKRGQAAK